MPYIMLPSGKQVRVDERGKPVEKNPGPYIPQPGERVRVTAVSDASRWRVGLRVGIEFVVKSVGPSGDGMLTIEGWQTAAPGHAGSVDKSSGACMLVEPCAAPAPARAPVTEEPPPHPVAPRRFCGCGQELFGIDLLAAQQGKLGICGECRRSGTGDWRHRHVPLDARIKAAQPEVEEHAFERPGYSWP